LVLHLQTGPLCQGRVLVDAFEVVFGPNANPSPPRSENVLAGKHDGVLKVRDLDPHVLYGPESLDPKVLLAFPGSSPKGTWLREGDVVLTVRGSSFRVAIVPANIPEMILGAGLALIRSKGRISTWPPNLLRWYLFQHRESHSRDWVSLRGQLQIRKEGLESILLPVLAPIELDRLNALVGSFTSYRKTVMRELMIMESFTANTILGFLEGRHDPLA